MQCKILRPFLWSENGITEERAAIGTVVDIPDRLVSGLEAEGYLTKDAGPSPENKMMPPPENKARRGRPPKAK